jgi:hypothetical protein
MRGRLAVLPVHVGKYAPQPFETVAEDPIRRPGREIQTTNAGNIHSNHRIRKK